MPSKNLTSGLVLNVVALALILSVVAGCAPAATPTAVLTSTPAPTTAVPTTPTAIGNNQTASSALLEAALSKSSGYYLMDLSALPTGSIIAQLTDLPSQYGESLSIQSADKLFNLSSGGNAVEWLKTTLPKEKDLYLGMFAEQQLATIVSNRPPNLKNPQFLSRGNSLYIISVDGSALRLDVVVVQEGASDKSNRYAIPVFATGKVGNSSFLYFPQNSYWVYFEGDGTKVAKVATVPQPTATATRVVTATPDYPSIAAEVTTIAEIGAKTTFNPLVGADGKAVRNGSFIYAWWIGSDGRPLKGFVPPPMTYDPDAKPAPFVWNDRTVAADAHTIDGVPAFQNSDNLLGDPAFFRYWNNNTREFTSGYKGHTIGSEGASGKLQYAYIDQAGRLVIGINVKFGPEAQAFPEIRKVAAEPKAGTGSIDFAKASTSGKLTIGDFSMAVMLIYKNLYGRWVQVESYGPDKQLIDLGRSIFTILY